jgi:hypothetical protein
VRVRLAAAVEEYPATATGPAGIEGKPMFRLVPLACLLGLLHPPALSRQAPKKAPRPNPTLTLVQTAPPAKQRPAAQQFVFRGSGAGPIHRAGPEHFRLTQTADGKGVALAVAYDRETLDEGAEGAGTPRTVKARVKRARSVLRYNYLFKGVRLSLESGRYDAKEAMAREGYLDLFGRADLRPGVRYRLTWACWPVGATEAAEVSCEFMAGK